MDLGTSDFGSTRFSKLDIEKKSTRKLKAFVLRKSGHTYCFCYLAENERAAIKAAAECDKLETVDVFALACYLGHDPHELGLNA